MSRCIYANIFIFLITLHKINDQKQAAHCFHQFVKHGLLDVQNDTSAAAGVPAESRWHCPLLRYMLKETDGCIEILAK
jgi:hypothetical protein